MFCVLYEFNVKPDHADLFRQHWLAVTQWYYRHAGSLGSRLHTAHSRDYIGYAQWTSRDGWEQGRDKSDSELQGHRQAMRECCEEIGVIYKMEVTDDWLQQEVYGDDTILLK